MPDLPKFELPGIGLKCGKCGDILPQVDRTVKSAGFVIRERICPGCGSLNSTTERVIATRERRTTMNSPCQ